jgi:hypothetical protein
MGAAPAAAMPTGTAAVSDIGSSAHTSGHATPVTQHHRGTSAGSATGCGVDRGDMHQLEALCMTQELVIRRQEAEIERLRLLLTSAGSTSPGASQLA